MRPIALQLAATALAAFFNTNAGAKLYVCATAKPDDLNQTAYEALTWVQVKGVGNHGESGSTTNIVSYNTWDTNVLQKGKGITDAGSPTVELARIPDDPGQIIMRSAAQTNYNYAFKIMRTDTPNADVDSRPTTIYNRGLVSGPTRPNGRNEDFDLEVFHLAFNQEEIVVYPIDGTLP